MTKQQAGTLLDVRDLAVRLDRGPTPVALVQEVSFALRRGEFLCIVGESGSGKTVTALSLMRLLEYTAPTRVEGSAVLAGAVRAGVALEGSDEEPADLVAADQDEMAALRGRRVAMVFQEAMEALNPTKLIGTQLVEAAHKHPMPTRPATEPSRQASSRTVVSKAAHAKALDLLTQVGIPDPPGCMEKYPHQLSGGMQQRVMIAMSLMSDPELLIADEPTTALDVTTQAEILTLLVRLQREREMACILITHDMGVAAEIADRVAVMYAGRLVEIGAVKEILAEPRHPYTRALLDCVPRIGLVGQKELRSIPGSVPHPGDRHEGCGFAPRCSFATDECATDEPSLDAVDAGARQVACWHPQTGELAPPPAATTGDVLAEPPAEVEPYVVLDAVTKRYAASARGESLGSSARAGGVTAVDSASFTIGKGEFFGLVGESGSGKSTLGRLITKLEPATGGSISIGDVSVEDLRKRRDVREFRRDVQIVFQDTTGSLDPRRTIGRSVSEPLRSLVGMRGPEAAARAADLLEMVGLPREYVDRMPAELSGGQRQRVAIARAIACDPQLVVADEPTSALDVSVQGQIVNVLRRLQRELGLTYLFITHNLSLVLSVADRIGVMYLGAIVEIADAATLTTAPAHPYTEVLLRANPDPHAPRRRASETAEEPAVALDVALDSGTELVDRTVGCRFRDRCPRRQSRCDTESPALSPHQPAQLVACHFPLT